MAVRLISAYWAKTFVPYFQDMIYVEFIQNFHLADSKEAMAVRSFRPTFDLSSGGRNASNRHQLARIGERKIFHELDVHHSRK